MAQAADEMSAKQIAKGEEERATREAAEHPVGESNEEIEGSGSGRAPYRGGGELVGGCTGANACAASNIKCSKESLFGEGETGVLWLVAAINCNRPVAGMQIVVQIWFLNPQSDKYEILMKNGKEGQYAYGAKHGAALIKHICAEGQVYKAWVWGVAWGTDYWFGGTCSGEASKSWTCEGDYAEWAINFVEFADG
jgi:hypothetical protein